MTRAPTLVLVLLLAGAPLLEAQELTRPPLTLVPHGDSVLVYVTESPPLLGGFVVYRARAGQSPERVTGDPVRSVHEPALAAGMLGADLPAVIRALRATDEGEMLRRLHGDRFAGTLLSLYYRSVATVLGRFYADGGLTRGVAYEYQVVFTDGTGRETDRRLAGQVTLTNVVPASPTGGSVTAGDHAAMVGWQYPKYRGDPRDFVIGFHVYRADGSAGEMRRLTTAPVLRDDAALFAYHDGDVRNDVAYRYQVTAVDMLGVESAPGAAIALRATDKTPPAIPVGDGARVLLARCMGGWTDPGRLRLRWHLKAHRRLRSTGPARARSVPYRPPPLRPHQRPGGADRNVRQLRAAGSHDPVTTAPASTGSTRRAASSCPAPRSGSSPMSRPMRP